MYTKWRFGVHVGRNVLTKSRFCVHVDEKATTLTGTNSVPAKLEGGQKVIAILWVVYHVHFYGFALVK